MSDPATLTSAVSPSVDEGPVAEPFGHPTDVFDVEPPGLTPLIAHPRVIAAPHMGAFTAEGGREAVRVAVANLIASLAESTVAVGAGAR